MSLLRRVRSRFSLGALLQLAKRPQSVRYLPGYALQLARYRKLERKEAGYVSPLRLYPCLDDAQAKQSVHYYYFYQDCWAARHVFQERPSFLVDVGSTVLLVGILSQFVPCISIDIRPVDAHLEGLTSKTGSVLRLPFDNDEVPCLTTMCVLEHVGLGRYGDPLDPLGTMKALEEIKRVVAPGGMVIYSVPIGQEMLEFNAHRRFTAEQAVQFFPRWELLDACILTPTPVAFDAGFDTTRCKDVVACFSVRKPLNAR